MIPQVETIIVDGEVYVIAQGRTYALGPIPRTQEEIAWNRVREWAAIAVFVVGTIVGYGAIIYGLYRWSRG